MLSKPIQDFFNDIFPAQVAWISQFKKPREEAIAQKIQKLGLNGTNVLFFQSSFIFLWDSLSRL